MPKKKTALTIEERLQQALVPAEEQPYEVPENWVWTYWKNCGDLIAGSGFKKEFQEKKNLPIPFYKVGSLKFADNLGFLYDDENTIDEPIRNVLKATLIKEHSIIFAKIGEAIRLNRRAVNTEKCCIDNNLMAFTVNAMVLWRYAYFWTLGLDLYSYTNSTTVPAIRKSDIELINFPLPPLSEQQRIVERIEELFAKLDEAKERLQEVADSFAVRKAAILHKAFTGELTKKHGIEDSIVIRDNLFAERENMVQEKVLKRVKIKPLIQDEYKSQLAKNWVQCKLGEVAFVTKLAGFEYTKYIHLEDTGEIPVVRAQNVRKGYLDTTNLLYISKSVSDALSRSALKEKSVLITFIGAGIGDACVFDENQQYHLAPNVAKVEPFNKSEEKLNVYFLLYYLLSSFGQYEIFKNMKATAQPSLSMETIREIIIPLPSIEEQHEIVRLIDDLLARERAAQQAAEQALARIDLMKKSILARAFRGERGTNKASDASALELLRQVLAEN